MVLHRSASGIASHPLRVCGAVVAYAFAMVTGTAVLIAAFGAGEESSASNPVSQPTAERGVQAADAFLLASRNNPNDKRGF